MIGRLGAGVLREFVDQLSQFIVPVGTPTSSKSPEARVESVLAAVLQRLEAAPDTPQTRELRAQARVCEKAVRHWSLTAPSEPQVDAMLHLVTQLHGLAAAGGGRETS